jgi:glycosyltransferase involved in cell wall biosynthesis
MVAFDFYFYHTKVKNILKKEKYDYTISFYQFLPSYLTEVKSTKHIIWLHGSVEHFFIGITKFFIKNYEKKLVKYDYIVTVSNEMKNQLEEFYPALEKDKIKMIYNPFDFKLINKKSIQIEDLTSKEKNLISDNYFCTVSRLDNPKDIVTLILAYEVLYRKNKITDKLYVVGDGSLKDELISMVNEKKLQNNILFLGEKNNPFIWMKYARLFVFSSKNEGFGMVIVEAMAVNTFVISSDCKVGPKEILENGKNGDLFTVGDYKELSTKISKALNNENYRQNKILNAKNRIIEFDKDKVMDELINLLES